MFSCLCLVWFKAKGSGHVFGHLDFKIVVEPPEAAPFTVVLLAPSRQEKAAWMSDISQVSSGSGHVAARLSESLLEWFGSCGDVTSSCSHHCSPSILAGTSYSPTFPRPPPFF